MDTKDTNIETTSAKKENKPTKPKNETKKTSKAGPPQTRSRAKSTLVSNFEAKTNNPNVKKDIKPVETIGNDRFKNLLSMFDNSNNKEGALKEDPDPKKLDMNKFSAFSGEKGGNADSQDPNKPLMSEGIKKKMQDLLDKGKAQTRGSAQFDPVLKGMLKDDEDEEEQNDEHGAISEEDDLNLSAEDEEKDKSEENEDAFSKESEDEDKNDKVSNTNIPNTEVIENKVKELNINSTPKDTNDKQFTEEEPLVENNSEAQADQTAEIKERYAVTGTVKLNDHLKVDETKNENNKSGAKIEEKPKEDKEDVDNLVI